MTIPRRRAVRFTHTIAQTPQVHKADGVMKIEQFLKHYGIARSPFSEEDAQTDIIFKQGCLWTIHHPAWTKFFGSPNEPSTALVFGEKGSGKTALRLQAAAELEGYNKDHPDARMLIISYDDFNPYLDQFQEVTASKNIGQALKKFQLQDHMDAILSLGVTHLLDEILERRTDLTALSPDRRRDLLMLAALYDQSTAEPIDRRWSRLRRRSGFRSLWSRRDLQLGIGATLIIAIIVGVWNYLSGFSLNQLWLLVPLLGGWLYWAWRLLRAQFFANSIRKGLKVLNRDPADLRWALLWFQPDELSGQPLPTASRNSGEQRYELLRKFQGVLKPLGYHGIIVLIDRVDEPQAIEGDPRRMRDLVWPMLDNKFLRHPGIGVKLLLPIELAYYLEKEEKEFYDRARPDKLNMIKPLRWTGPSLYDLATDRLRACMSVPAPDDPTQGPRLRQFVDQDISDDALRDALNGLRTPRQLFKFLHRLLEEHCHRHTSDNPRWAVDTDTFRTVYNAHIRDLDAFDRGFGHG